MSAYLLIGLPGHGKSFLAARQVNTLLWRNYKWYKKTGNIRYVCSNLKINDWFFEKHPDLKEFIRYWSDPRELVDLMDVDVVWDEIARHLDSRMWADMDPDVKALIQENDKIGIDIYANTQSPMQVDIMFRRNCEWIKRVWKLIGSRRPSPTRPAVKYIWGCIIVQKLKRETFHKEEPDEEYEKEWLWMFNPLNYAWIDNLTCKFFNTRQRIIRGVFPPLKHAIRYCEKNDCELHKHGKIIHY